MLKYIKCGLTQNPPDQTMQFPAAAAGVLASGRKFLAVIAPNLNITARVTNSSAVNVILYMLMGKTDTRAFFYRTL
jgi:hypothetical protein